MIKLPDFLFRDYEEDKEYVPVYILEEDIPKLKKWLIEYEMNEK